MIGTKVHILDRTVPGTPHTYVHAKTWIFDDEFAIVGSVRIPLKAISIPQECDRCSTRKRYSFY